MMWNHFFEAGGWGMYPTSLLGFLLVASGVLLVLRPERRFVPLVLSMGVVTLGSGLLSASVGIVNAFHYLRQVDAAKQLEVTAMGCAESLHNIVLALILIVITALLGSVAALRSARSVTPVGDAR